MDTKKTKAIELRAPSDEGDVVRKGSRVLLDTGPHLVTRKAVSATTGFVSLSMTWIPSSEHEMSGRTHQEECSPDKLFDEIIGD